jgi:hypothetical protein
MYKNRIIIISLSFFITYIYVGIAGLSFAQNVSVNATVPPQNPDFQLEYEETTHTSSANQNQTLTYRITYGAKASAGITTTNTIVAKFDALFPNGSHVLSYMHGSATNGFGNSQPVVDLNKHTITWNISALPPGVVDQHVYFQLRTTNNYTGPTVVNFTTYADMSNQYVVMPTQRIAQVYRYDPSLNGTDPGSPVLTVPTPAPLIPTPTQQPRALRITDVAFREISKSGALIEIKTNNRSKISVKYGHDPKTLSKTTDTKTYLLNNLVSLKDLSPGTNYYLQITATDESGQKINSEIYFFTTALDSEFELTGKGAAAIGSGNILVPVIAEENGNTYPLVVITTNTDYKITYILPRFIPLNSLNTVIRNKSDELDPLSIIPMFEQEPRLYSSHLQTTNSGRYSILARLKDLNGNIREQNIANIKVIDPLTVYVAKDLKPLADARVMIYYLNLKTNKYEPLNVERFGKIKNPQFTDKDGELDIILPAGKYKAVASAFGHSEKAVEFTLGERKEDEFPKILLEEDYSNILYIGRYARDWLLDTLNNLTLGLQNFSESARFFNAIATLIIASFAVITLLLFTLRSKLHLKSIPVFLMFHIHQLFKKHRQKYIYGSIQNEAGKPVSNALVNIIDEQTGKILTHIKTGRTGRFYIANTFTSPFKILAEKEDFVPYEVLPEIVSESGEINIKLKNGNDKSLSNSFFVRITEHLIGSAFESFLIASLLSQLLFYSIFGLSRTLPFFILSLINILLWAFYTKEHLENKSL